MFSKEFLLIMIGRLVVALAGLLSIKILTTYLTIEQYGQYALLIAVQTFCGLFLVNPVGQFINLNTHRWYDDKSLFLKLRLFSRYLVIVSIVGAALTFCLFKNLEHTSILVLFMCLFVLTQNLNHTLIPLLNMIGYRLESVKFLVISTSIALLFSVFFLFIKPSIESWIIGQTMGLAVGILSAIKLLARDGINERASDKSYTRGLRFGPLIKYCFPLAVATGFMWLGQNGYRFVIDYFWGVAELAMFVLGFQLSAAIWSVIELLAIQFLYPYFYRRVSDASEDKDISIIYSDLINSLLPVYVILLGFFMAGGPYILKLLASSEYQAAYNYFIFGVIVEFFRALSNVLTIAAHVKKKTQNMIPAYVISAFIVVGGAIFVGVFQYSIDKVGYVLVVASFLMCFINYYSMNKLIASRLGVVRLVFSVIITLILVGLMDYPYGNISYQNAIWNLFKLFVLCFVVMGLFQYRNTAMERLLSTKLK